MRLAFVVVIAAALSFGAQAQDSQRERNLSGLLDAVGNRSAATTAKAARDEYLTKLPDVERFQLLRDLTDSALSQGLISKSEHARERLDIARQQYPDSDWASNAVRELWSYRVVIATKLERKEISPEEYDYLAEKSRNEFNAEFARRAEVAEQHLRTAKALAAAQQDRDRAEAAQFQRDLLNSLQRPRTTVCRTIQTPGGYQSICQ